MINKRYVNQLNIAYLPMIIFSILFIGGSLTLEKKNWIFALMTLSAVAIFSISSRSFVEFCLNNRKFLTAFISLCISSVIPPLLIVISTNFVWSVSLAMLVNAGCGLSLWFLTFKLYNMKSLAELGWSCRERSSEKP